MWYLYWLFGIAAAVLTAYYMARMMIFTFHGANRTGERERTHLHEAPWIMTGPLLVLGVLSIVGGALNVPELLGGHQRLHHWLEPVTSQSGRWLPELHLGPGAEWALMSRPTRT